MKKAEKRKREETREKDAGGQYCGYAKVKEVAASCEKKSMFQTLQ